MTLVLPEALRADDDAPAKELLRQYYGIGYEPAVGAAFDTWDSTGTRAQDANRFTADDIVAVSFLSVAIPPSASQEILAERRDRLSELLEALGPDRDLADLDTPLPDSWNGWELMSELKQVPHVGTTSASKLFARKRPRLRPVWDSVVAEVTDAGRRYWEPLRQALRDDDGALHRRLLQLRDDLELNKDVSALRVFDVIAWKEGKRRGL